MMKNNKKWFTLVELVVVAVILSILATVGFISYEEYLVDTRDSKRLAQMTGLRDGLRLAIIKWKLPLPDDNVEIRNNATTFLYQGYAGENVLEGISYSEATKDPYDDKYYTYLLSRNRKDFQILGFLEEYNPDVISSIFPESYATDYSQRFPQVMGKKLWIVLEQDTNTPLQEMTEYIVSGYMDLNDVTTNNFDAYVTDTQLISWNEGDLIGIIPFTTCKKIKESGDSYGDGIYNINPSGLNPFEVYCDMTLDWWGWTLLWRSVLGYNDLSDFGWIYKTWNIRDDTVPYSLGITSVDINFSEIAYGTYISWKGLYYADKIGVDDSYLKNNYDQQGVDPESASHTEPITSCTILSKPTEVWCGTSGSNANPDEAVCTACDNYRYNPKVWGKFSLNGFMLPWRTDYEHGLTSWGIDVGGQHPYFEEQGMIFVR